MPQGLSGLFQLGAQLPLIQGPANCQGQLSQMLSLNVIEGALCSELRNRFTSEGGRHEEQRNFLHHLMEELQSARSLPTWARVLRQNDVISVGPELFCALRQRQ